MANKIVSKRGGAATHAKDYRDTLINAKEAAMILRQPISRVRERVQAGEIPVEGWDKTQPYFKAGAIMDLAASPS